MTGAFILLWARLGLGADGRKPGSSIWLIATHGTCAERQQHKALYKELVHPQTASGGEVCYGIYCVKAGRLSGVKRLVQGPTGSRWQKQKSNI